MSALTSPDFIADASNAFNKVITQPSRQLNADWALTRSWYLVAFFLGFVLFVVPAFILLTNADYREANGKSRRPLAIAMFFGFALLTIAILGTTMGFQGVLRKIDLDSKTNPDSMYVPADPASVANAAKTEMKFVRDFEKSKIIDAYTSKSLGSRQSNSTSVSVNLNNDTTEQASKMRKAELQEVGNRLAEFHDEVEGYLESPALQNVKTLDDVKRLRNSIVKTDAAVDTALVEALKQKERSIKAEDRSAEELSSRRNF